MAVREARGLGTLIRPARERMGWTQEQLAKRINMEKSYVSAIERGTRQWPRDNAEDLAEALSLDLVEMAIAAGVLPEAARRRQTRPEDAFPPDDPMREVILAAHDMDYDTRKALRDYALFLRGSRPAMAHSG